MSSIPFALRERTTEFSRPSIDPAPQSRNNSPAWHPQLSVDPFTPNHHEEHHEGLQPQGRRRLGTGQPNHRRRRRTSGKRDSRIHQVSQRRSGPGGAHPLHQSPARGLQKTYRVRRLHGAAPSSPQVVRAATQPAATRRRDISFGIPMLLFVLIAILFLSACGHPRQAHVNVPPPPPPASTTEPTESSTANVPSSKTVPKHGEESSAEADLAEPTLPANARPVATETGLASWYGPPYHNRRGSNGEIYNMHAMTAAHRTFPLGSIVRVTNVKTGSTALVRITDRGPFIPGRVVALPLAAGQKVDVWKPGIAKVKVELMQSPASPASPGKWAVQIGGFPHEHAATKLADHLKRRYHTANVLCFASPAGDWWIRIRVLDDDHERAQKLAAETQTPEGSVFLVRLD